MLQRCIIHVVLRRCIIHIILQKCIIYVTLQRCIIHVILPALTKTFQTLIKEMNRLGMIVDLSHSSVQVVLLRSWMFWKFMFHFPSFCRRPVTRWRSLLPLWFSLTHLLKHCATLHEMYLTNSSSWRYYSFKCPYLGVVVYLSFFPGGQEGPGDDQLLLLLHNLFKCFIYNRCDRWVNLRYYGGLTFDCQHISTMWGRWLALTPWA